MLTEGKTDSELLRAMVVCLLDNDADLIGKLRNMQGDNRQKANVEVLVSIAHAVNQQLGANPAPEKASPDAPIAE